jgi:alpha-maltose-1-phosphate synthase
MNGQYKIAILSTGRFHLLDLARELSDLGYDVKFYSYVPKKRAIRFGLPPKAHVGLLPYLFPLVAWQLFFPRILPKMREWLLYKAINYLAIIKMKDCDLIIAMSGIFLEALNYGKRKFSAQVNLHRGSKNILVQNDILKKIKGAETPSILTIKRELEGYEICDHILIASKHVYESFAINKNHQIKCKVISYGVDLNLFPLKLKNQKTNQYFKAIYAGMWTYRKGCDLLIKILETNKNLNLTQVGDIGDCKFPKLKNLTHINKVEQYQLSKLYEEMDFFVLASREDGFGVVLSQALASGLPILATFDTGGPDLQLTPALADRIILVKSDDLVALRIGFEKMMNRLENGPEFMEITESDRLELSWKGYGERYHSFIQTQY